MAKCEHDLRFQGLTRGGNAVCMICQGIRQGIRQGGVKALLEMAKEFENRRWHSASLSNRYLKENESAKADYYNHASRVYQEAETHCRDEAAKLEKGDGE